ncbi:MAG: HlyD family efflux transporter periplasmic adaptor subunit [Cyanobacteriota bacterium]
MTHGLPWLPRLNGSPAAKSVGVPKAAAPTPRAVAALGRLEPGGDIRILAAPGSGFDGGSPRITDLLVVEGENVRAGQLLAHFDSAPSQRAERQRIRARRVNLIRRLKVESRELARYRRLTVDGAISADELDHREQQYLELQGQLHETEASLLKIEADLSNTELRAPIDGTVLRIHTRVGERAGDKGVLEMGDSARMEAVLEVYESDIARVRLGQRARISSENGGFKGQLNGVVTRISPQVRQRQVLSTDPSSDADARIVEVRLGLDPVDARKVKTLTGLKVIGRLEA